MIHVTMTAAIQNKIRYSYVSSDRRFRRLIFRLVISKKNFPSIFCRMLQRLFVFTSALMVVSTTCASVLSNELAQCISKVDEKTLVCMIDLITKKGFSLSEMEEVMIGRPNIEEREIQVGQMNMKAWKYLPTFEDHRPSIVLIPGMTGHQVILKELARALMPRFSVYSIDSLGYGESSGILPADMMHGAVESVEKLMIEFGLEDEETIVAGHSLGGMIALNFGLRRPKLRKVINVDGGWFDVAQIIGQEDDTAAIERERMIARMALFRTNPEIVHMVSVAMQKLVGFIRAEVEGTSAAWHAWLDAWYASGEWDRCFAITESPILVVKAVMSDSASGKIQEALKERFSRNRPASLAEVKVVSLVTTHEQIVLLRKTIEAIVALIE